jgi:uncharacterized protein
MKLTKEKVTSTQFKSLIQKKESTDVLVTKEVISQPIVHDDDTRRVTFIASTAAIDRTGDSIKQEGFKLDNYLNNPVVFFGHNTDDHPIAKCVKIGLVNNNLTATFEFMDPAIPIAGPKSEAVYQMIKSGYLNAVSVGFRPIDFKFSFDPDRENGLDFNESELTEISVVGVPANPEALVVSRETTVEVTKDVADAPDSEFVGQVSFYKVDGQIQKLVSGKIVEISKDLTATNDPELIPQDGMTPEDQIDHPELGLEQLDNDQDQTFDKQKVLQWMMMTSANNEI